MFVTPPVELKYYVDLLMISANGYVNQYRCTVDVAFPTGPICFVIL